MPTAYNPYLGLQGDAWLNDLLLQNPYGDLPMTVENAQLANRWWQDNLHTAEGAKPGTWDSSGNYTPTYQFHYDDSGRMLREDGSQAENGPLDDPTYRADYNYFVRAATGAPGTGWAVEDPKNDPWYLSFPKLVIAGTAIGSGAAAGAEALGAGAGAGAAGAGATEGATAGTVTGVGAGEIGGATAGTVTGVGTGEIGGAGSTLAAAGGTGSALVPASEGGAIGAAGTSTYATAAPSTGLFGTGVTTSQALKGAQLLGAGASALGGGSGSGGGSSTTTGTSGVLDKTSADLLKTLLGEEFPTRFHGWMDTLNAFTQRANASPEALNDLASPELRKMGQAILDANRTTAEQFGPYGGAQIGRAQGKTVAGQPVLQAYTSPWLGAESAASGFVGGTKLPIQRGTTSQETTTYPVNIGDVANTVSGLAKIGSKAYDYFGNSSSSYNASTDPVPNRNLQAYG